MHPVGRLRDAAGMDVESRADARDNASVQHGPELVHPMLLSWGGQTNPDEVGTRLVEHGGGFLDFDRRQLPIWWRVGSDDLEPWKMALQPGGEIVCDPGASPVEEVGPSVLHRTGADIQINWGP